MQRRTLLKGISGAVAAGCAAVTAVPIVRFLLAPVTRKTTQAAHVQRIATLDQLPPGRPKQFAITGRRRDAWTLYPHQVIGRVWVVRHTDDQTPPDRAKVDAYSAECPHLGCTIEWNGKKGDFLCPCHQAAFTLTGKALDKEELGYDNPAPRNMDLLKCRIVHDAQTDQWWVEVTFERFRRGLAEKVPV